MIKLSSVFKKPLNFQCESPQGKAWREATPESSPNNFGECKLAIFEDGTVLQWLDKHLTGVLHTKVEGGKWKSINGNIESQARMFNLSHEEALLKMIKERGFTVSEFRRPKKASKSIDYGLVDYIKFKEAFTGT
jgi:hypothetical protein